MSPTGLPTDPPLTAHGEEQARELAAHLATLDPAIDQVYSSPYYRCLQTVAPYVALRAAEREEEEGGVGPRAEFTIRGEAGLSDWYGSAPFDHPTSAPRERLKELFPSLDAGYSPVLVPTRRGESIPRLHERVARCLRGLISQADQEGLRAVLLCAHAATVIAIGRVLTGAMPDDVEVQDFGAFTCGLSVYRRRRNTSSSSNNQVRQAATSDDGTTTTTTRAPAAASPEEDNNGPDLSLVETNIGPDTAASSLLANFTPPPPPAGQSHVSQERPPPPEWAEGRGLAGGFDCVVNCDCSFLSGGEERGCESSSDLQ